MDMQERLAEFYRRLNAAPPARSADEALALVSRLIEQVEDELSGLPREEPPPLKYTGRMYAPQPDRLRSLTNGTLVAETRQHRIYCHPNGAISIVHMPDRSTEFTKPGTGQ